MYHPSVIALRQSQLESQPELSQLLPQGLIRYPLEEAQAFAQSLIPLLDAKGRLTRPLRPDEQSFILNEQLLTKIDWRYWAERYCQINHQGEGFFPLFPLWESQTLVLHRLAGLEKQRVENHYPEGLLINVLKARQLGMCLAPTMRVLTADLRWIALDDVHVGDSVVAVDEFPQGGVGAGRYMRTAIVEAKREVHEPAFCLTLDNGIQLIATAQHRFLTRNRGGVDTRWRPVSKMIVGECLRLVTKPWEAPTLEDAWFGGLVDGEGCLRVKNRAGVELSVSQVAGAVWDRASAYMRQHGYQGRTEVDQRKPGRSSKFGKQPVYKLICGRMGDLFRLLGQTRPTRFLAQRWWEGKELPGKRIGGACWVRITSIVPLGPQRMIDLQTSTKTFLAEGIVSHNSTLTESLLLHRVTTHTHTKALIAGDVDEQSQYLFGILEKAYDALPWFLKPALRFRNKHRSLEWETESEVLALAGKSNRGGLMEEGGAAKGNIGRGKTFSLAHVSEVSTWERPDQLDGGLFPAIPRNLRSLAVIESTAKGRNDWWHKQWRSADRRKSRFVNIFIPWYAEVTKYWLPAPLDWSPAHTTLVMAKKAEIEGPRWLGTPTCTLTREQLFWYEVTRSSYEEKERLGEFLEEYAADPEECFQHSGRSVFTLAQMEYLRSISKPPINVLDVQPRADLAQLLAQSR